MRLLRTLLFSLFIFIGSIDVIAQDPTRFAGEIEEIQNREFERDETLPLAVFTGSSSIRMWNDLVHSFPGYQVLNNGFGGSEFSDLIYYKEELIFNYKPEHLFIYEGDNDINSGKNPSDIAEEANNLVIEIKNRLPETKIFLISPKPSISRWELREQYLTVNLLLNQVSKLHLSTYFIDVWNLMMDENGEVRSDLFIEDDLHMNETGYEIWKEVIGAYLPQN
jgi:lysophospholipase L1-like esterase